MKLRAVLYLAAAFLAAALALTVLPACSDEASDTECAIQCGNDCFVISDSGVCVCVDLIDDDDDPDTPDVCPL